MIDQIIARAEEEGAGITAKLEFQNMFVVQIRVQEVEVGDISHMFVRHHMSLGVVPDVSVTGATHHHRAPGPATDMRQDIVIGGGQSAHAAGVEGLLVAEAVLLLLDSSLTANLVLMLNSLKMLTKY